MTTDKKKLRELARAATPGEWSAEKNCVYTLIHDSWKKGVEQFRNFLTITCYISKQGDHGKEENANAAFISAANPKAVIELLDEVERLRQALVLILPMAKGYAHANPVGKNGLFIEMTEKDLARSSPDDAEVG